MEFILRVFAKIYLLQNRQVNKYIINGPFSRAFSSKLLFTNIPGECEAKSTKKKLYNWAYRTNRFGLVKWGEIQIGEMSVIEQTDINVYSRPLDRQGML